METPNAADLATLAHEFPDYPAADLPPMPAGFRLEAWHNETCPQYTSESLGLTIWLDFADPAKREFPVTESPFRYLLESMVYTPDGWQVRDEHAGRWLFEGDDWAACLAAVLANADHGRRERARLMAELTAEAVTAVSRMAAAYMNSGRGGDCRLNDEQPLIFAEVIPESLDEYALSLGAAAAAWRALSVQPLGADVHTGGNVWTHRVPMGEDFAIYGPALFHPSESWYCEPGVFNVFAIPSDPDGAACEFPADEVWSGEFERSYDSFADAAAAVGAWYAKGAR